MEIEFLNKPYGVSGSIPCLSSPMATMPVRQAAEVRAAVSGLCRAAGVSRAGYCRFLVWPQPQEAIMDLRSQIQRIALRWPAYGYRRVHAELLRHSWTIKSQMQETG